MPDSTHEPLDTEIEKSDLVIFKYTSWYHYKLGRIFKVNIIIGLDFKANLLLKIHQTKSEEQSKMYGATSYG